ncbi:MAG TPA: type II toxin-antitoxin system VapC family toxin [Promineifilum sp.]|nr:type II toxin-antitoxin system VapC family toxin [Promineifilum sp.]HRQ14782.1 type II toxin-antitoxin system VapC family toxin [Promineifilum sp.]
MILCDTNILIEFYKNNPEINAVLRSAGHTNLAVSIITQAELYFGALNKNELESIQRHLALITCIQVSESISHRFIRLMESYSLSHKLAIPDALIAATAIENELALYTLNRRDFRFIQNLQLFEP